MCYPASTWSDLLIGSWSFLHHGIRPAVSGSTARGTRPAQTRHGFYLPGTHFPFHAMRLQRRSTEFQSLLCSLTLLQLAATTQNTARLFAGLFIQKGSASTIKVYLAGNHNAHREVGFPTAITSECIARQMIGLRRPHLEIFENSRCPITQNLMRQLKDVSSMPLASHFAIKAYFNGCI